MAAAKPAGIRCLSCGSTHELPLSLTLGAVQGAYVAVKVDVRPTDLAWGDLFLSAHTGPFRIGDD